MGGRVAEELFMNHMTSGASNDIERATDIAQHMVCEFGHVGARARSRSASPGNAFEADRPHGLSEATAQRVDEAIRRVVMNGYDRARGLIEAQPRSRAPAGRGAPRARIARGRRDSRDPRQGRGA